MLLIFLKPSSGFNSKSLLDEAPAYLSDFISYKVPPPLLIPAPLTSLVPEKAKLVQLQGVCILFSFYLEHTSPRFSPV